MSLLYHMHIWLASGYNLALRVVEALLTAYPIIMVSNVFHYLTTFDTPPVYSPLYFHSIWQVADILKKEAEVNYTEKRTQQWP